MAKLPSGLITRLALLCSLKTGSLEAGLFGLETPTEPLAASLRLPFMRELVSDEMRATVAPLSPEKPSKPKGGRPRCSDRDVLRGIVFVARSGIPWEMLTQEVFGCSGMSCWRRLRDWHKAGVWDELHLVLLERLHRAGELDWSRAAVDSASVRARKRDARRVRTRRTAAGRGPSDTARPTPAARRSA